MGHSHARSSVAQRCLPNKLHAAQKVKLKNKTKKTDAFLSGKAGDQDDDVMGVIVNQVLPALTKYTPQEMLILFVPAPTPAPPRPFRSPGLVFKPAMCMLRPSQFRQSSRRNALGLQRPRSGPQRPRSNPLPPHAHTHTYTHSRAHTHIATPRGC